MTAQEFMEKEKKELTEAINEAADIYLEAMKEEDEDIMVVFQENIKEHIELLSEVHASPAPGELQEVTA